MSEFSVEILKGAGTSFEGYDWAAGVFGLGEDEVLAEEALEGIRLIRFGGFLFLCKGSGWECG